MKSEESPSSLSTETSPRSSSADPTPVIAPVREVLIDWEALEDAFENNAAEVHSYLHLSSGEVLRVVDGIADPQMHSRIAVDSSYVRVDPVNSREQYRWMERFIQMLSPGQLRDELTLSIDGRGAFRRFKDVLMLNAPEREQWFAFRSERLRVFVSAWLEAHALQARASEVEEPAESSPVDSEAVPYSAIPYSQDDVSGRRSRNAEWLRKALNEIAVGLSSRDLDRVLTFAEFVKSRRTSRSYAARQESGLEEEPTDSED